MSDTPVWKVPSVKDVTSKAPLIEILLLLSYRVGAFKHLAVSKVSATFSTFAFSNQRSSGKSTGVMEVTMDAWTQEESFSHFLVLWPHKLQRETSVDAKHSLCIRFQAALGNGHVQGLAN